jgi:hypothetical protein
MKQNGNRSLPLRKRTISTLDRSRLHKINGGTSWVCFATEVVVGVVTFAIKEGIDDGKANRTK